MIALESPLNELLVFFLIFFVSGIYRIAHWTIKLSLAVMSFTGLQSFKTWRAVAFQKCVWHGRRVCWTGYQSRLPTVCNKFWILKLKKQASYDGSKSLIVLFYCKGLNLTFWAGWCFHSCSAPELLNSVLSHFLLISLQRQGLMEIYCRQV